MRLEQNTGWLGRARIGSFVRDNWLIVFAVYPFLRVVFLAELPAEMTRIQASERFLWLSCGVVEIAVIIAAMGSGFRVMPFLQSLHPKVRLLVVIWLAALAIATLRAEYFELAIRSAFEWLMHGVFSMAVWHLVIRDRARFVHMFDRFASLLPWMTVLAGLVVMGLVYSIGLSSDYPFGTDIPGFSHIRHSGYIFAPAMALCLSRLATVPHEPRTCMLLLVLNVALCLWFGSRGPFFGLVVGLVIACALFPDFRSRTFWVRNTSAVVAGAVLSVAVPSPENPAFNAVRRFLNGSIDPSQFSSGRTEFWKETAGLILDRPLFGYGGAHFQFVSHLAKNTYRHPHDFVLQVVFDWGIFGGGAFLGLLALIWVIALKVHRNGSSVSKTGFFGMACMLGFALLDGILFYPYPIAITLVFFAAALLPAAEKGRSDSSIIPSSELRLRASG